MLQNKIIEPSVSPFNSNPLLVNEKDNSKRFVIDFRNLNKTTTTDSYPLSNVEEMLDQCYGCSFFTQLDLASGYSGIPIQETDRAKTVFSVPRGKHHFTRMPFGLKNAQATFQHNMDMLIEECKHRGAKGVDTYVDNCIIMSQSFDEHLRDLRIMLEVLNEAQMSLRINKCEFAFPTIEFLGFVIDGQKVKPAPGNVAKILKFPLPTSRKKSSIIPRDC